MDPASVDRPGKRCDPLSPPFEGFIRVSYERSLPVTGIARFDAGCMVAFMHRVIEEAVKLG